MKPGIKLDNKKLFLYLIYFKIKTAGADFRWIFEMLTCGSMITGPPTGLSLKYQGITQKGTPHEKLAVRRFGVVNFEQYRHCG